MPVSIAGVKEIAPNGFLSLRPGTVRVLLHPPTPTAGRRHEEAEALAKEVRQIVIEGCAGLALSAGENP